MSRAQASITVAEAAIGILLVASLTFVFALDVSDERESEEQLDLYAADTATILANEPPRHGDQTRLAELVTSEQAFEREQNALETRIDRILPDNVMFRVETRYGTAGYRLPSDVPTGTTTVVTPNGEVTLRVWYV